MRASMSPVCIVGIAEAQLTSTLPMNRLRTIGARIVIGLTIASVLLGGADQAQSADQVISEKELIVGTKEAPPFVMKRSDGTLYGISIDLWRRVAEQLHLRYHFSEQETIQALLL